MACINFTQEQEDWLLRNYKDSLSKDELTVMFNKEFGTEKSMRNITGKIVHFIRTGKLDSLKDDSMDLEKALNREKNIRKIGRETINKKVSDFSELKEGDLYKVISVELGSENKYVKGETYNSLKFLYQNEDYLCFESQFGYKCCFPRHRNMMKIYEKDTGREVCKSIKMDISGYNDFYTLSL